jgi:hypothetical protein
MPYPPLVSNGIFDLNLFEDGAIVKLNKKGVANGPLLRVMIVNAEALVFNTVGLSTKSINTWVGGCFVSAILGVLVLQGCSLKAGDVLVLSGQAAVNQGISDHVADRMATAERR